MYVNEYVYKIIKPEWAGEYSHSYLKIGNLIAEVKLIKNKWIATIKVNGKLITDKKSFEDKESSVSHCEFVHLRYIAQYLNKIK